MSAVTLPITFRAVGVEQANTPLKLLQRTVTHLAPDELLVRVSYSSINPLDMKVVQHNPFRRPLPLVPGGDYSGTVVAVGGPPSEHQEAIAVGSEVFGFPSTGADCFAEYVVVKREFIALRGSIPANEAGAWPQVVFTAVDSLELTGEISKRSGQWIYVAGAAGGVGHVAVQLAKRRGLRVIGSASKPAALDLLKALGVDHIIDYSKQDVVSEVLSATGGRGADVVYDPTYELSSFAKSSECVAAGGVWIKLGLDAHQPGSEKYGKVAEARGATALTPTFSRWSPAFGGWEPYISEQWKLTQYLRDAVQWYESGELKVHVSQTIEWDVQSLQEAFANYGRMNVAKVAVHIRGSN